MLLADTSVWIRHFRQNEPVLAQSLSDGLILMHPFIAGELACGNWKDRSLILRDLNSLPAAKVASNAEVFSLLESKRLWGRGLGWVDLHLLASAMLSGCPLWTLDKGLAQTAKTLRA